MAALNRTFALSKMHNITVPISYHLYFNVAGMAEITLQIYSVIPKGSKNIMVAGRSLSSDRLANSAARVQATCMAVGQATAVTAVLAARQGISPREVDLGEIRTELIKHKAIVIGQLQDA